LQNYTSTAGSTGDNPQKSPVEPAAPPTAIWIGGKCPAIGGQLPSAGSEGGEPLSPIHLAEGAFAESGGGSLSFRRIRQLKMDGKTTKILKKK